MAFSTVHSLLLRDCVNYLKSTKKIQYELIVKLAEANKLNSICKNKFASQVDKIKSLDEELVKCKAKLEIVTSAELDKE